MQAPAFVFLALLASSALSDGVSYPLPERYRVLDHAGRRAFVYNLSSLAGPQRHHHETDPDTWDAFYRIGEPITACECGGDQSLCHVSRGVGTGYGDTETQALVPDDISPGGGVRVLYKSSSDEGCGAEISLACARDGDKAWASWDLSCHALVIGGFAAACPVEEEPYTYEKVSPAGFAASPGSGIVQWFDGSNGVFQRAFDAPGAQALAVNGESVFFGKGKEVVTVAKDNSGWNTQQTLSIMPGEVRSMAASGSTLFVVAQVEKEGVLAFMHLPDGKLMASVPLGPVDWESSFFSGAGINETHFLFVDSAKAVITLASISGLHDFVLPKTCTKPCGVAFNSAESLASVVCGKRIVTGHLEEIATIHSDTRMPGEFCPASLHITEKGFVFASKDTAYAHLAHKWQQIGYTRRGIAAFAPY